MCTPLFNCIFYSATDAVNSKFTNINISYVKVDYQIVGWFSKGDYTYLVLDVTITNHKCSEIYIRGNSGFTVVVNNDIYRPRSYVLPFTGFTNSSIIDEVYHNKFCYGGMNGKFLYSFYLYNNDKGLPSQATLLDTGSISGFIIFEFGDPTVIPQQPPLLNQPFILQYSSKERVIINQIK